VPDQATATDWTCTRCEVRISWIEGVERPEIPVGWAEEDGEAYCLTCRRERAGEAGLVGADDAPGAERQKLNAAARIEFELGRNPDGPDGKIASACRTSVAAVRKARERLGVHSSARP
jgi:hypothetical protein